MYLLLLKKALPFALTFVVGAALSGLAGLFGFGATKTGAVAVPYTFEIDAGPRHACPMGRHKLVAETRPLDILHIPNARWPLASEPGEADARPTLVRVTFGADGTVQEAVPLASRFKVRGESPVEVKATWEAVERAARRIRFTPELVNSVPLTVTRDVEIHFTRGD